MAAAARGARGAAGGLERRGVRAAARAGRLGDQSLGLFSGSFREGYKKDFEKAYTTGSSQAPPPVLSNLEGLRLLSKIEKSGLLSQLEASGVTLTALEESGLLSLAERLGLISAAADRGTPGLLTAAAFGLCLLGPAAVYVLPDDSTGLVVAQAAIAAVSVLGGAAAFGGAQLLGKLQSGRIST